MRILYSPSCCKYGDMIRDFDHVITERYNHCSGIMEWEGFGKVQVRRPA